LSDESEKNFSWTNTLAYFAAASVTKKKKFDGFNTLTLKWVTLVELRWIKGLPHLIRNWKKR
jgi:hypothetical protein